MSEKTSRDLALIGGELQSVLARESKDVILIGRLLIEARSQLEHGEWLPWLLVSFSLSVRSAENYMSAARVAAKYETVANLKLRPSALYALGNDYRSDEAVVEAVL